MEAPAAADLVGLFHLEKLLNQGSLHVNLPLNISF